MKKTTLISVLFLAVLVLSGCGATSSDVTPIVYSISTIFKTTDGGGLWESSSKDVSAKTIIVPEVLAMEVDQANGWIYVGTEKDGLLVSSDGGEGWTKLDFPLTRIYGLGLSKGISPSLYAGGLLNERGKVFKSFDSGVEWKEIYSEAANGPVISALAVDPKNADVVYVGNSDGVIVKTTDGGKSWRNITKLNNSITAIKFDAGNSAVVYFLAFNDTIFRTKNGGNDIEDLTYKMGTASNGGSPFSLETDPVVSGTVYVGLNGGILRSVDSGEKFESLNVIEGSKNFSIRALAVHPHNPKELIYNAAQAVYKSIDGGKNWSTSQLDITRTGSQLKYDPKDSSVIYLGLRKSS